LPRPDERPPFLDLCFLKGGKALGCLSLARRHLEPEFGEALSQAGVGHGLDRGGVQ
jgi:hypothetical protein